MSAQRQSQKPITVGLLIGSVQDSYENTLLRGAHSILAARGCRLITLITGGIHSYHGFEAQANVLSELATRRNMDGLIITGTLGHSIGRAGMIAFCRRYKRLPIVGIALDLPGVPGIMVESKSAISTLMDHLILDHGYQHIAYLRGPSGHTEAEQRYAAYQEALIDHDLPLNEKIVAQGDYTFESGQRAMQALLQRAKGKFQAVVSANDSMALGALSVMQTNNLLVPQEIALVGFDDVIEARFTQPPLTTIRQDVHQQGQLAAEMVLDLLANESTSEQQRPSHILVKAQPILRNSCGCQESLLDRAGWSSIEAPQRSQTSENGQSHLPDGLKNGEWNLLEEALKSDVETGTSDQFLHLLKNFLQQPMHGDREGWLWQEALSILRWHFNPTWTAEQQRQAESLIHQGRVLVAQWVETIQLSKQLQSTREELILREIIEVMFTTFTLNELLDVVGRELPRLGIAACYLALFEDTQHPTQYSRLIMAYDEQGRRSLPQGGKRFRSNQLIPASFLEENPGDNFVVEALYSRDARLGFVVMKVSPEKSSVCTLLRGMLSSALQSILLKEEHDRVEEQLRITNQQLELKAQALEAFAHSISHDLKGPLRGLDGYAHILIEKYRDILDADGRLFLTYIRKATKQMHSLIDDLLQYSTLERRKIEPVRVNLNTFIWQILADRAQDMQDSNARVQLNVPSLQVMAEPESLRQAINNLLDNALKFTRSSEPAQLEIGGEQRDNKAILWVRDYGVGFDMRYHDRIFQIFERLHLAEEYPGTGIGLAMVKHIMEHMGGHVWAESTEGEGATFFLEFNLPESTS